MGGIGQNILRETDEYVDMPKKHAEDPSFKEELESLLNKHSMENASDTPDWVLANYLIGCLEVFNETVKIRNKWYEQTGDVESLEIT